MELGSSNHEDKYFRIRKEISLEWMRGHIDYPYHPDPISQLARMVRILIFLVQCRESLIWDKKGEPGDRSRIENESVSENRKRSSV